MSATMSATLSTSMSATMYTSMSATAMSSRRFVRSEMLTESATYGRTDGLGEVLESRDTCVSKNDLM